MPSALFDSSDSVSGLQRSLEKVGYRFAEAAERWPSFRHGIAFAARKDVILQKVSSTGLERGDITSAIDQADSKSPSENLPRIELTDSGGLFICSWFFWDSNRKPSNATDAVLHFDSLCFEAHSLLPKIAEQQSGKHLLSLFNDGENWFPSRNALIRIGYAMFLGHAPLPSIVEVAVDPADQRVDSGACHVGPISGDEAPWLRGEPRSFPTVDEAIEYAKAAGLPKGRRGAAITIQKSRTCKTRLPNCLEEAKGVWLGESTEISRIEYATQNVSLFTFGFHVCDVLSRHFRGEYQRLGQTAEKHQARKSLELTRSSQRDGRLRCDRRDKQFKKWNDHSKLNYVDIANKWNSMTVEERAKFGDRCTNDVGPDAVKKAINRLRKK
jgi:hypothetical protein